MRTEEAIYTLEERGNFFLAIAGKCSVEDVKNNMKQKDAINTKTKELEDKKKNETLTVEEKTELEQLKIAKQEIETCLSLEREYSNFISFRENSAGIIRSVRQNIKILEQYKQFPSQLHQRTHLSDRYLTEISDVLSSFIGDTMYRLNTNATRYSQYIDALTIIIGAIETRQAIINFSINRSEKCAKCSNDNF